MKELKHLKTFESFSIEDNMIDEGWFTKTPEEKVKKLMDDAMTHMIAWKKQGYIVDMEQIEKDAMADDCKGTIGLADRRNKKIGYIPGGRGVTSPLGGFND